MAIVSVSCVNTRPKVEHFPVTAIPANPATPTPQTIQCVKLSEDKTLQEAGYLVLLDWAKTPNDKFSGTGMVVDTTTFKSYIVDYPWYPAFSPGGNAIAYVDYSRFPSSLTVSTEATTYNLPGENYTYLYWVNNRTIAVKEDSDPRTFSWLWDPFSGSKKQIATNFPDFNPQAMQLINPWQGRVTAFNALLTHVVYPSAAGVNLMRLKDEMLVAEFPKILAYDYAPIWSPAGDEFIIGMPVDDTIELAKVTVNGDMTLLTRFASTSSGSVIGSYSWSPDGKQVAFWVSNGHSGGDYGKSLGFINLADNRLTITCIFSQSSLVDYTDLPVWAPDSRQIAVTLYTSTPSASSQVIVDTEKLSIRVIPDSYDFHPIGWLTFNPEK